jgi:hypothetical protein
VRAASGSPSSPSSQVGRPRLGPFPVGSRARPRPSQPAALGRPPPFGPQCHSARLGRPRRPAARSSFRPRPRSARPAHLCLRSACRSCPSPFSPVFFTEHAIACFCRILQTIAPMRVCFICNLTRKMHRTHICHPYACLHHVGACFV